MKLIDHGKEDGNGSLHLLEFRDLSAADVADSRAFKAVDEAAGTGPQLS